MHVNQLCNPINRKLLSINIELLFHNALKYGIAIDKYKSLGSLRNS